MVEERNVLHHVKGRGIVLGEYVWGICLGEECPDPAARNDGRLLACIIVKLWALPVEAPVRVGGQLST